MNTATGLPLPSVSRGRFAYALEGDKDTRAVAGGTLLAASAVSDMDAAYMTDVDGDRCGWISAYTDEALFSVCGVRIAFVERSGGCSSKPYHSLNLKYGLGDTQSCVARNRAALFSAFGIATPDAIVLSPHQVHGTDITEILSPHDAAQIKEAARARAQEAARGQWSGDLVPDWVDAIDVPEVATSQEGSDAVLVSIDHLAALLCFADCLPLILVAPTGAFCVVHCGWKGTLAHLAAKATRRLADASGCNPSSFNAYIGPYIHRECFEVGADIADRFSQEFSPAVVTANQAGGTWHVDLGAAVRHDLLGCSIAQQRVADIDQCTVCNKDRFFSYRASGALCGRHGALAFRV